MIIIIAAETINLIIYRFEVKNLQNHKHFIINKVTAASVMKVA